MHAVSDVFSVLMGDGDEDGDGEGVGVGVEDEDGDGEGVAFVETGPMSFQSIFLPDFTHWNLLPEYVEVIFNLLQLPPV